jgi:hypothetical protein
MVDDGTREKTFTVGEAAKVFLTCSVVHPLAGDRGRVQGIGSRKGEEGSSYTLDDIQAMGDVIQGCGAGHGVRSQVDRAPGIPSAKSWSDRREGADDR